MKKNQRGTLFLEVNSFLVGWSKGSVTGNFGKGVCTPTPAHVGVGGWGGVRWGGVLPEGR